MLTTAAAVGMEVRDDGADMKRTIGISAQQLANGVQEVLDYYLHGGNDLHEKNKASLLEEIKKLPNAAAHSEAVSSVAAPKPEFKCKQDVYAYEKGLTNFTDKIVRRVEDHFQLTVGGMHGRRNEIESAIAAAFKKAFPQAEAEEVLTQKRAPVRRRKERAHSKKEPSDCGTSSSESDASDAGDDNKDGEEDSDDETPLRCKLDRAAKDLIPTLAGATPVASAAVSSTPTTITAAAEPVTTEANGNADMIPTQDGGRRKKKSTDSAVDAAGPTNEAARPTAPVLGPQEPQPNSSSVAGRSDGAHAAVASEPMDPSSKLPTPQFVCNVCSRRYTTKRGYDGHRSGHTKDELAEANERVGGELIPPPEPTTRPRRNRKPPVAVIAPESAASKMEPQSSNEASDDEAVPSDSYKCPVCLKVLKKKSKSRHDETHKRALKKLKLDEKSSDPAASESASESQPSPPSAASDDGSDDEDAEAVPAGHYKCRICRKVLKTRSKSKHDKKHKAEWEGVRSKEGESAESAEAGERADQTKCSHCKKQFEMKELVKHMTKCSQKMESEAADATENEVGSGSDTSDNGSTAPSAPAPDPTFPCEFCPEERYSMQQLQLHNEVEHAKEEQQKASRDVLNDARRFDALMTITNMNQIALPAELKVSCKIKQKLPELITRLRSILVARKVPCDDAHLNATAVHAMRTRIEAGDDGLTEDTAPRQIRKKPPASISDPPDIRRRGSKPAPAKPKAGSFEKMTAAAILSAAASCPDKLLAPSPGAAAIRPAESNVRPESCLEGDGTSRLAVPPQLDLNAASTPATIRGTEQQTALGGSSFAPAPKTVRRFVPNLPLNNRMGTGKSGAAESPSKPNSMPSPTPPVPKAGSIVSCAAAAGVVEEPKSTGSGNTAATCAASTANGGVPLTNIRVGTAPTPIVRATGKPASDRLRLQQQAAQAALSSPIRVLPRTSASPAAVSSTSTPKRKKIDAGARGEKIAGTNESTDEPVVAPQTANKKPKVIPQAVTAPRATLSAAASPPVTAAPNAGVLSMAVESTRQTAPAGTEKPTGKPNSSARLPSQNLPPRPLVAVVAEHTSASLLLPSVVPTAVLSPVTPISSLATAAKRPPAPAAPVLLAPTEAAAAPFAPAIATAIVSAPITSAASARADNDQLLLVGLLNEISGLRANAVLEKLNAGGVRFSDLEYVKPKHLEKKVGLSWIDAQRVSGAFKKLNS